MAPLTRNLALTMVLFSACADDAVIRLQPAIVVDPESLDFGDGLVGGPNALPLVIKNDGEGILEVQGIDVEGATFSVADVPRAIGALDEKPISVIFTPIARGIVYEGALLIRSNDREKPQLRVPLRGRGGEPKLEVTPLVLDFGLVNEGTSPRRAVEIRNSGLDVLTVQPLVWTSTSADLGLDPATFSGGMIAAQTATVVTFVYSPRDLGTDSGMLEILSRDVEPSTVTVQVRGRANLRPLAVAWLCETRGNQVGCDGQQKHKSLAAGLRRRAGLDGRDSTDPEGEGLMRYQWTVMQKPTGSMAIPFHSTEDITMRDRATGDVEVDRVGDYVLVLTVRDARGLASVPTEAATVTLRPKDLEVRLSWDIATDIDLHLVQPGGTVGDYGNGRIGTSTGSDCSTYNRGPNWNDLSSNNDDPSLDKDEVTGLGPEIVSVDAPDASGAYSVFAHYCDSRRVNTNASVTARVYVRGELIATIPEDLGYRILPGQLWEAARIVWDANNRTATVEGFEQAPATARPDLCLVE